MRATFNAYLFNPVFWYVRRYLADPRIRTILVRGGSSAGKTYSICDAFNIMQLSQVKNVFALRKHRVHVETTIKKSFETSIGRLEGLSHFYTCMDGEIRIGTGALTTYAGMDDSEKVKGLESYDIAYCNELNQFESGEWDELNRRMRGRPGQQLVADWNPILSTHWINKEILEPDDWTDLPTVLPEEEELFGAFTRLDEHSFVRINAAGDTVWINVTYRDNFWIVGHPGNTEAGEPGALAYRDGSRSKPVTLEPGMFVATDGNLYGFEDKHTVANFEKMRLKKPNDYRIYGLGQDGLMRTGGEFWPSFDQDVHVRPLAYDPAYPLHVSVDNNRNPYITISIWQVVKMQIRQIAEIPAKAPHNTASKAALLLDKWLTNTGTPFAINIYGDPSANTKTTEDDEGRSFFEKFIGTLDACKWKLINRVGRAAPGVALSGEFINDIYEGEVDLLKPWKILINIACPTSVEDYSLVKKEPNGSMSKEKVPDPTDPEKKRKIEKYGHFSDAKRYFITTLLSDLYLKYKNRNRTPRAMSATE